MKFLKFIWGMCLKLCILVISIHLIQFVKNLEIWEKIDFQTLSPYPTCSTESCIWVKNHFLFFSRLKIYQKDPFLGSICVFRLVLKFSIQTQIANSEIIK